MKKVTAFIGTKAKKATYLAVQEFEKNLKQHGEIEFEYVFLSDYQIEFCRGCKMCFLKGEEYCPIKDDRNTLLEKLEHSDGVVWATPTYTFQVTARLKGFLDRLAFICHRPRFFGKTAIAIVTQGIYGGRNALKYLNFVSESLGFRVSKGYCLTTLDPITETQRKRLVRETKKAAARFYDELQRPMSPPSFFRLAAFRMGRTSVMTSLDQNYRDYQHYKERGWFESDYYYPTSLGWMKKLAGSLFDFAGRQMAKRQMK
jgi:multimeric flavodoxin WrbA